MSRYTGKVVLVTGAGSGIGAGIARRLAAEGAAVLASDVKGETAEALASELAHGGARALACRCDVAREDDVRAAVDRAVAELGRLDLLVNNAGIGERDLPIDERSSEAWHRVIETNLTSAFYGIKHAARVMKAAKTRGAIVNVASILAHVGLKGAPAYTAAKHGLVGLTKAAALELAPFGIRVVAVAPAFIRTPLIAGMEAAVLPLHPIGRLGEVEDVAGLVAYLGSDEAAFLTGASYAVDGGYLAQ